MSLQKRSTIRIQKVIQCFPLYVFVSGSLVAVKWSILLLEFVFPTARSEVVNRVRREAIEGWVTWQKQQTQDDHGGP